MPLHWFNSPIYVSTAKHGERYAVTNAERAAEFLLSWREHSREEAWRAAVSACMACMKGEIETERAREAFEAAARSIGHLV